MSFNNYHHFIHLHLRRRRNRLITLAAVQLILLECYAATAAATTREFQHLDVRELDWGMRTAETSRVPPEHVQFKVNNSDGGDRDGTLVLELVHRDVVSGKQYPTHRHRVEDIIRRDSLRVATLTRLLLAHSHDDDIVGKLSDQNSTSTMGNQGTADPSSDGFNSNDLGFGSEVVSGLEEGSGEYLVRIGVGSPPRDQYMVVDSGSDVVWVQCQPCAQCYRQSDPVFDPSASASFAGVPCGSAVCALLDRPAGCSRTGRCRYEVSYGDGSYTTGTLALETLTFGRTSVRDVAMGCGHRNHGLFVGAAGLLGLGGGPMSFVGQLAGQVGGAFSYCLVTRGLDPSSTSPGSLVFGRGAAIPVGAAWVPMLRNPRASSYYYVGLTGLAIGGVRLGSVSESTFLVPDLGCGGMVMDTGTAVTRLPNAAYVALRDTFVQATTGLPRAPGVSIFETCYALGGFQFVRVPTVSFYFSGGTALTLPARNFLIPVDGVGTFCLAFAGSGESGMAIMGNIQQEGIQITFDSASGYVGFGPYTC